MTIYPGEAEWRWAFLPYRHAREQPAHPQDWDDTKGT